MNIQWDSQNYTKQFSFVHQYGEDVLKLLGCPPGSRVIDLGCGNGALTEKLAQMGYQVLGIDDSEEMIQTARRGLVYPRTFYFPTIGEYAPLLEEQGFRVECALLFDRPTVQKTEQGLENWIRMFVKEPFAGISDEVKEEIIRETVEALRGRLYQDGKWFVDYVRIRIKASLQRADNQTEKLDD